MKTILGYCIAALLFLPILALALYLESQHPHDTDEDGPDQWDD